MNPLCGTSCTYAVKPFDVCNPASDIVSMLVGPRVLTVDLMIHSEDVFWRLFGANSMVRITNCDVDVVGLRIYGCWG